MARTALLVGPTGLVGGHCLNLLLQNSNYEHVTALSRRALTTSHAKLSVQRVDFENLEPNANFFAVDDVYSCLGTTIKVAGSQEKFRRVDHDYTLNVAKMSREMGARRLALVSSVGASSSSSSFYLQVKGDTERDVAALGYESLVIARPSLLIGDRLEKRAGEKVGIALARTFGFLLAGGLRKYRAIEARTVAEAMIDQLIVARAGERILQYDELH